MTTFKDLFEAKPLTEIPITARVTRKSGQLQQNLIELESTYKTLQDDLSTLKDVKNIGMAFPPKENSVATFERDGKTFYAQVKFGLPIVREK